MQNNASQNYLPDSSSFTKDAAFSTSSIMENQRETQINSNTGRLALYTWGTLATLSMIFAAGFLLLEIKIQESVQLAEIEAQQYRQSLRAQNKARSNRNIASLPTPKSPTLSLTARLVPADQVDQLSTGSIGKKQYRINGAQAIGFGASLGTATSSQLLASRYLVLSNSAPELFVGLNPKFQHAPDKVAKLIVGPFKSESELRQFCKGVRSRMAIGCTQENYTGKKLLLPPLF